MSADPVLVIARELARLAGAGGCPPWAQRIAASIVLALDAAGLAVVPARGRR